MRILIVGGGTAGHVLPAVPVIEVLRERGHTVEFVGTHTGLETRLLAQAEVRVHEIHAGKLRRYWSWRNLTDMFRTVFGIVEALGIVLKFKPDAVFSKGGFVSFPVAFSAWLARVPIVAHESDLTPGLANRLVLRFAKTLCVSFAQTQVGRDVRLVHTGTPIRASMLNGDAEAGRRMLQLAPDAPLLVITGGSLGADTLNRTVREIISELTQRYTVLHVCGPGKEEPLEHPRYLQREYVSEGWGDLLAAADLVISRAGANALFELLALRKLNVLVPLSAQASRGDQIENAQVAQSEGYSIVVSDAELSGQTLLTAVDAATAQADAIADALAGFTVPPAATLIANEIEGVATRE